MSSGRDLMSPSSLQGSQNKESVVQSAKDMISLLKARETEVRNEQLPYVDVCAGSRCEVGCKTRPGNRGSTTFASQQPCDEHIAHAEEVCSCPKGAEGRGRAKDDHGNTCTALRLRIQGHFPLEPVQRLTMPEVCSTM